MPAVTLAKSGKRYTHEEWTSLDIEERTHLLTKFGPGYSDDAYRKHFGNRKPMKKIRT